MSLPSQIPPPRVGAKSHTGKVRSENQDRMSRFATPLGEVFLVADGMGGHEGGATAARLVSEGFEQQLGRLTVGLSPQSALQSAAQQINAEIFRQAHAGDPRTEKMGSTAVLALVAGSRVLIGHAGDSRAYLFRHGRLQRLTKDHSAVQKMIDHHMLSEAEARNHPDASVINRAFGQTPELELELSQPLQLQSGDGLLLCTDGLCGYVDDAEIERVIRSAEDAQQITELLIDLALATGGEDNVTIQYLQFGPRPPLPLLAEEQPPRERPFIGGLPLEQQLRSDQAVPRANPPAQSSDKLALSLPWLLLVILGGAATGVGLIRGIQYLISAPAPGPSPSPIIVPSVAPAPAGPGQSATPPTQKGPSSLPSPPPGNSPPVIPPDVLRTLPYPQPAPPRQGTGNPQPTPAPAQPSPSATKKPDGSDLIKAATDAARQIVPKDGADGGQPATPTPTPQAQSNKAPPDDSSKDQSEHKKEKGKTAKADKQSKRPRGKSKEHE